MDRNEFLARRMVGIGGSDIAAIIGISPWRTPRDIYLNKKGLSEPDEETDAMYWGHTLEDIVAKEYSRRTGRKIEKCNAQFRHEEFPFILGNIDRAVRMDQHKRPVVNGKLVTDRILECKTASQYSASDWGESGTQVIPEYYKAQVQWYMGITGAQYCDVAVLIGNRDFRMYEIPRDDNVIEYLFGEGVRFWTEFVEKDIMPPAVSLDDIEKVYHGKEKARKFATAEIVNKIEKYKAIDNVIKTMSKEQEELKIAICEYIGDAVDLVDTDSKKLASWSASKTSYKTNYAEVVKELNVSQDILGKHTKETVTSRRFTISK